MSQSYALSCSLNITGPRANAGRRSFFASSQPKIEAEAPALRQILIRVCAKGSLGSGTIYSTIFARIRMRNPTLARWQAASIPLLRRVIWTSTCNCTGLTRISSAVDALRVSLNLASSTTILPLTTTSPRKLYQLIWKMKKRVRKMRWWSWSI